MCTVAAGPLAQDLITWGTHKIHTSLLLLRPLWGPEGRPFSRETRHQACSSAADTHGLYELSLLHMPKMPCISDLCMELYMCLTQVHIRILLHCSVRSFLNQWYVCLPVLQDLPDSVSIDTPPLTLAGLSLLCTSHSGICDPLASSSMLELQACSTTPSLCHYSACSF